MSRKKYTIFAKCFDKRGRLISVGMNNYRKSHPIQQHFANLVGLHEKIFLHAEIQALLRAGDKKVHRILVERYDKQGNPANAEPCPVCKAAIKAWDVQVVDFTV
jgi:tRNA(Arg) A34 adenosine deaminase TadA